MYTKSEFQALSTLLGGISHDENRVLWYLARNEEFNFDFYFDILPGNFIVGIAQAISEKRRFVFPVMFGEHGLFSNLQEIDSRSPERLMRYVELWAEEKVEEECPGYKDLGLRNKILDPILTNKQNLNNLGSSILHHLEEGKEYIPGNSILDLRLF